MKYTIQKAFTFVELVVVITILAILGTIGFASYISHVGSSRDSKRISDLNLVQSSLQSYKQIKGAYPLPGNSFNITNSGTVVALQGRLNKNVSLSTLEYLPLDPIDDITYFFSITKNKQEFQLAGTLENGDSPKSIVIGSYQSVAKQTLPTILLATGAVNDVEIHTLIGSGSENRKLFIFNESENNYPYDFKSGNKAYSSGVDFDVLIADADSKDYWQNSDFTSCLEIFEAGKSISSNETIQEYEYVLNGTLEAFNCNMASF